MISKVKHFKNNIVCTTKILKIGTDNNEQTLQMQIRLLLMEQSDQDLHCIEILGVPILEFLWKTLSVCCALINLLDIHIGYRIHVEAHL